MKKILLCLTAATLAVSCKKVPEGGNKSVIKLEEGAVTYADDSQGQENHTNAISNEKSNDLVDINFHGKQLKGKKDGFESQLIKFLESEAYNKAADDSALKDTWYDFDNINFKLGKSNELEPGSEVQLKNLSEILKAYPTVKIKIGGYTDKTGNEDLNLKLSSERATYIKSQLTQMGIGNQIVSAEGYGSKFAKVPADASDNERASDRRMALRLTK